MTEQMPPPLPRKVRDEIVARHATPDRPLWREPLFWVAGALVVTALVVVVLWVRSTLHDATKACVAGDTRGPCIAAAAAQGVASKANSRLQANGLPPVPTPSSAAPLPTVTVTLPAIPGPAGAAGPSGATGPAGPSGATGHPGATGPQGVKGDPGIDGTPGAAGPSGATVTGPAGANGKDGTNGTNGTDGATGPQGEPGPSGPSGPAGPDCPTGYTPSAQPQLGGGSTIVCTSPPPGGP